MINKNSYKYFYRLGTFTKESQKKFYDRDEGQLIGVRFDYVVDKKYDNCGWDVRSWEPSSVLKEITKESYNEIVDMEKSIKKQQKEIGLKQGHHYPIRLNSKEISKLKKIGIKFNFLKND